MKYTKICTDPKFLALQYSIHLFYMHSNCLHIGLLLLFSIYSIMTVVEFDWER